MLDNKMTVDKIDICKIRKTMVLFLAGFIVLALATNSIVFAAGKVKASGMLTSIEDDGSVIIDEKGYWLSPSVVVRDYRGDRISLRELPLSSRVEIEYEYAPRGFAIISIKELAQ